MDPDTRRALHVGGVAVAGTVVSLAIGAVVGAVAAPMHAVAPAVLQGAISIPLGLWWSTRRSPAVGTMLVTAGVFALARAATTIVAQRSQSDPHRQMPSQGIARPSGEGPRYALELPPPRE